MANNIDPSSMLMGWLTGEIVKSMLSKKPEKEPVAYLYNGVRLPKLPEWDKETYPYAHAWFVGLENGFDKSYKLSFSTTPVFAYGSSTGNTGLKYVEDGTELTYEMLLEYPGAWQLAYPYEPKMYKIGEYGESFEACGYDTFGFVWSNHDIYFDDGTLYLAKSDPIPVVGEKEPVAGLYETGTHTLIYSWDDLTSDIALEGGAVHLADGTVSTNYTSSDNTSSDVLSGDLVLPAEVNSIDNRAFSNCVNITNITIPSSVTVIGNRAFYTCKALEKVAIPNGVTVLELATFRFCTALKRVAIPATVTTINNYVFDGCTALRSIVFEGTMAEWTAITFGTQWNGSIIATEVICSDGAVKL